MLEWVLPKSLAGKVIAGSGTTIALDGYLRGIITGVGEGELYVNVVDKVSAAGVSSAVEYHKEEHMAFLAPTTTTVNTTTGIATVHWCR